MSKDDLKISNGAFNLDIKSIDPCGFGSIGSVWLFNEGFYEKILGFG